jgi:hypothetical protein
MEYLGWSVSFDQDGERKEQKLINFVIIGSGAQTSVWALCLCPDTGTVCRVKVLPNDNDFVVSGDRYRPLKA